jgi:HD superfamily phosphodiesterase
LPAHLSYHGFHHTLEVYQNAQRYAAYYNIEGDDLDLLLTGALYHDSGFVITYENHEEHGCELVREVLPRFEYSTEEVEIVCGMIMATKIPQKPKSLLEEIICDSDLDYLGRDDFYRIGNELYLEFSHVGIVQDERSWNELQVRFLEAHHFHTEYAIKNRLNTKKKHLKHLRKLVAS